MARRAQASLKKLWDQSFVRSPAAVVFCLLPLIACSSALGTQLTCSGSVTVVSIHSLIEPYPQLKLAIMLFSSLLVALSAAGALAVPLEQKPLSGGRHHAGPLRPKNPYSPDYHDEFDHKIDSQGDKLRPEPLVRLFPHTSQFQALLTSTAQRTWHRRPRSTQQSP